MLARIILLASSSLALALLAACDGEVSSSSSGGSGGANQGGGGSNQGGGGVNQGGGGVGGTGGCPADAPSHGDACDAELTCDYETTKPDCGMTVLPLQASCKEGTWRVLYPASCSANDLEAGCPVIGHFMVTETGPYDNPGAPIDGYKGPFDLFITVGKGGILQVERYRARLAPSVCGLEGGATIDEDCFSMGGDMFCTYIDRKFNLGFGSAPATGTVTLSCWGECGFEATAPVEAVKQP